jgi:hypothetical protein
MVGSCLCDDDRRRQLAASAHDRALSLPSNDIAPLVHGGLASHRTILTAVFTVTVSCSLGAAIKTDSP